MVKALLGTAGTIQEEQQIKEHIHAALLGLRGNAMPSKTSTPVLPELSFRTATACLGSDVERVCAQRTLMIPQSTSPNRFAWILRRDGGPLGQPTSQQPQVAAAVSPHNTLACKHTHTHPSQNSAFLTTTQARPRKARQKSITVAYIKRYRESEENQTGTPEMLWGAFQHPFRPGLA